MIDRGRHNILGVMVDAVDYQAAVSRIIAAALAGRPAAATALAVHGVMTGVLDREHRYRLNHLDMIVPDGQPVRWALNLLHQARLADRVYGPTLMLEVCRAAAAQGLPVYLYGSRPEVVVRLSENLRLQFPGLAIAGVSPSSFRRLNVSQADEVANVVRRSGARICFVGLGCPRQEVWAYEFAPRLQMPVVAVGAAFDFHAGLLAQAPPLLGRLGLEWLYRLAHEPRRLWRRYLLLNPAYLGLLVLQLLRLRRFDPADVSAPTGELLYG